MNRKDSTGHFWSEIWEFAKTSVAEIGKAMFSGDELHIVSKEVVVEIIR